jgi:hypothetical protein
MQLVAFASAIAAATPGTCCQDDLALEPPGDALHCYLGCLEAELCAWQMTHLGDWLFFAVCEFCGKHGSSYTLPAVLPITQPVLTSTA